MIYETSRYSGLPIRRHKTGTGEVTPYLARRFLPSRDAMMLAGHHVVAPTERIDHLAHAAYSDATQFWRLADTAGVGDPLELEMTGRTLAVPMAGPAFLEIALAEDEA